VEFWFNGIKAGELTRPPWKLTIDTGEENIERRLRVVATAAGGQRREAEVVLPPIQVDDELDLPLQQLYITASRDGQPVADLARREFRVLDMGNRQEIVTFEHGDIPLTAALLIDSSLSMRGAPLRAALAGAHSFASGMAELDEAMLLLFSDRVMYHTAWTGDPDELLSGLEGAEARGGSAVNDHLFLALQLLEKRQGRRVVILLSDGVDVESLLAAAQVNEIAVRSQALIYWIRASAEPFDLLQRSAWRNVVEHSAEIRQLAAMVDASGGRRIDIARYEDAEGAPADSHRAARAVRRRLLSKTLAPRRRLASDPRRSGNQRRRAAYPRGVLRRSMKMRRQRRPRSQKESPNSAVLRTAAVALLLAAGALAAAEETPPPDLAPFDESIEVRRVNVDVVVVDAAGEPVRDLGAADFALFEDGRSVEILNFAEYSETGSAAASAAAAGTPPSDTAAKVETAGPISWVIYVDSGKVSPGPRNEAAKNLQTFLLAHSRPEDRVLVAGFDGRALRLLCPLTTDRAAVDAALAAMAKSASDAVARRSRAQSLVQQMQSAPIDLRPTGIQAGSVERGVERSQYDPKVDADRFWLELESFVNEEGQRERSALRALDQLLGMISGFEGRVALLLVGAPIDVRPGDPIVRRAQSRLGSSPDAFQRMRDVESRQVDLSSDVRALFERANASRVTVFTIDAAEERELGIGSIEETGLPSIAEGARTGSGAASASMALAAFAAATGGRSFRASPGLADRLAGIATDLESYYSLAYEPPRAGRLPSAGGPPRAPRPRGALPPGRAGTRCRRSRLRRRARGAHRRTADEPLRIAGARRHRRRSGDPRPAQADAGRRRNPADRTSPGSGARRPPRTDRLQLRSAR
jgi:VWFA-related protein